MSGPPRPTLLSWPLLKCSFSRNYHIFYQLIEGSSGAEKEKWRLLASPDEYRLLSNGAMSVDGIDDVADFQRVKEAMETLGTTFF